MNFLFIICLMTDTWFLVVFELVEVLFCLEKYELFSL